MSKILTLLSLILTLSFSAWSESEEIVLSKDEFYQKIIEDGNREKKLFFRWTLYKNGGLVVLLNYDGFNKQFILRKEYFKNSFRLNLYQSDNYNKNSPFLYLVFREFKDNKAKFNLYLKK